MTLYIVYQPFSKSGRVAYMVSRRISVIIAGLAPADGGVGAGPELQTACGPLTAGPQGVRSPTPRRLPG